MLHMFLAAMHGQEQLLKRQREPGLPSVYIFLRIHSLVAPKHKKKEIKPAVMVISFSDIYCSCTYFVFLSHHVLSAQAISGH